jgi:hypothetical protein
MVPLRVELATSTCADTGLVQIRRRRTRKVSPLVCIEPHSFWKVFKS